MAYNAVTFHNAAVATANGVATAVQDYSILGVQITGTFVATVTFEGTIDGTNYVAIEAINVATGAKATTATAAGVYRMGIAGFVTVRARLAWTSGTSITVTGRLTEATDPMIQDIALIANSGVDIGDVDVTSIAAGETHIGEVGCNTEVVSVTPTITAGAYTALDIVGGVQTIAAASRVSGEPTILQSIVINDLSAATQAFTIWFFNANPSNGTYTDNIALDIHDTDLAMAIGHVKITSSDYASATDNSVACKVPIGLPLKPAATSLFAIAQCTGTAPTYVSTADLTFRYGFLRD
jgi:hypothetical protein